MRSSKIEAWLNQEMIEHLSWAFVAYLIGIIISYNWNVNLYMLSGFILVSGISCFLGRKNLVILWGSIVCFFLLLGMLNTHFQINLHQHSILEKPLYKTSIQATVLNNQFLINKQIVTLNEIRWQNPDLKMPQKLRLHFKKSHPLFIKGDRIEAIVSVYPPDRNFSKGFYRQLWFDQIGATGIIDRIKTVTKTNNPQNLFDKVRQSINHHLQ